MLAIRLSSRGNREVWLIFARNWGNEGSCGTHQYFLNAPTLTLRIPWREGAVGVREATDTNFRRSRVGGGRSRLTGIPGQGAFMTFRLLAPRHRSYVYGELHLEWQTTARVTTAQPLLEERLNDFTLPAFAGAEARGVTFTTAQLRAIRLQLGPRAEAEADVPIGPSGRASTALVSRPTLERMRAVSGVDPAQTSVMKARLRAICQAFNGQVPGHPRLCEGTP